MTDTVRVLPGLGRNMADIARVPTDEERRRFDKEGQLCWTCEKACGGCSWSSSLTPVPGWTAERRDIGVLEYGISESYQVFACPEYEEDE